MLTAPRVAASIRGKTYIVGIAGAYNAFGLIGPEHNGIFVLNETERFVVTDQIERAASGYFGPTKQQWAALEQFMKASEAEFAELCRNSPRYRGAL